MRGSLFARLRLVPSIYQGAGSPDVAQVRARDFRHFRLTVTLHIGKQVTASSSTFGVGLPGRPLNVRSACVKVTAGFEYDQLTFGLRGGAPFVSASGRLSATVGAGLASGTVRGSIGFMEIAAKPSTKTGEPTALSVALTTDVTADGLRKANW